MIAASGFKRLGLGIAAAAAAVIGAIGILAALVPGAAVREAVTAEIRAATGLEPLLDGGVDVALFPSGHVTFAHVRLGDPQTGETALAAERLVARLRLLPLLIGRVQLADVDVVRPTIRIAIDHSGRTNWAVLVASLARALTPNAAGTSVSEIRIIDGTVLVEHEARHLSETISRVDLALAWPSISRSFAATGRFVWRNEPVDVSLNLADFAAALVGNRSGLKLRLSGALLKLAFDGQMSLKPTAKIDGMLALDSVALRDALHWAGQQPPPGGGFGRFALKAQTSLVGGTLALTGVNVELDGNSAEGVLSISGDRRPLVQGTLAADAVDLTPYVSTVRLVAGSQRNWNVVPISLDALAGLDFDLRVSAARVTIAGARVGRTALAINLRGGRLAVTVGESQAFGGVLKGSFGLAAANAGADLKAQFQFSDVDLESCLGAMFGLHRIEGKGDFAMALEAAGGSILALTQAMSGQAVLTARAGALNGLNVEQALRRLERRPLSGVGDFRTGRTPFEQLAVALSIHQGTVKVDKMQIDGTTVRLALGGSASIPGRELDLRGTATLVSRAAADQAQPFELPFVVQGSWDDPVMRPDAESLIRRSGAAAPLLDAMRDRSNRDALRSAIERLTGRPATAE